MSIERRYPLLKHDHDAADITSGVFDPARLGSGLADTTKFLRGDSTWSDTLTGQLHLTAVGSGANCALSLESATPGIVWDETDQAADARRWDMVVNSALFRFRAIDSAGTARNLLAFSRSGAATTAIQFGNATDNMPFTFLGTGQVFANAGTAALPTYSCVGATTSGLFFVGNDSRFATGGVLKGAFRSNAEALSIAADSATGNVYMSFYESNAFTTRKGYFGYGSGANDDVYLINEEAAGLLRFGTNTRTNDLTIDASGNITANVFLRVGTATAQSTTKLSARASSVNSFEWGHSNTAGFGSTIGYGQNNGRPFVAFHAEHGTTANTFMTRGIIGNILQTDAAGALQIGRAATASADNQTLTVDATFAANGGLFMAGASGGSQGSGTINAVGVYDDGVLLANQTGANPTASVGLSAVNGSAGTFMRSDAAPALSQSIAPTWSASHTYSLAAGGVAFPIVLSSATPGLLFNESDQGVGGKVWRDYVNGGVRNFEINDDTGASIKAWLSVARSTGAVSSISFGNATDNNTYSFLGTGVATFGGTLRTANGTTSAVAYGPSSDPNTGIIFDGADGLSVVLGGTSRLTLSTTVLTSTLLFQGPAGTSGGPTYSFSAETTLGWYRQGAGSMRASVNADVFEILAAASGGAKVADFGGTLQTVGFRHIPQNSQSVNYTCVLADSGKHIYHPSGGGAGDTFTIPSNASVAYDIGTAITFINDDSNAVSIAITTDTLVLSPGGTTGTRTLAAQGVATAVKVTSTRWLISGTGLT